MRDNLHAKDIGVLIHKIIQKDDPDIQYPVVANLR